MQGTIAAYDISRIGSRILHPVLRDKNQRNAYSAVLSGTLHPVMYRRDCIKDDAKIEIECHELIKETPEMDKYIKRFVSADDFINHKLRYCLWLKDAVMSIIRKSKTVMHRLEIYQEFRENSKQKQEHAAATPYLFSSLCCLRIEDIFLLAT